MKRKRLAAILLTAAMMVSVVSTTCPLPAKIDRKKVKKTE